MYPTRERIVRIFVRRTFLLITPTIIVSHSCFFQPQISSAKRASLQKSCSLLSDIDPETPDGDISAVISSRGVQIQIEKAER
jgi:hypothetical protein